MFRPCGEVKAAAFNRRMRKTARPVVWEGDGAQSPSLDPIQKAWPHYEPVERLKAGTGKVEGSSGESKLTYSVRRAIAGSTRVARRAGM